MAALVLALGPIMFASPAMSNSPTVINTPGGDDSSYQIPLSSPVVFFGQEYTSIWATTNAVITFGRPDGTFHDFPMTPSISLGSQDWEAYAGRAGEQFVISYTDSAFQVDMIARPFGSGTSPTPSRLVLTGIINQDRTINFSYYLENVEQYPWLRFGVRTPQGQVLTLEQANFQESEAAPTTGGEIVAPEPTPEPTPESTQSPETEPSESPTVSPEPSPEPTSEPTESPTVSPEPPFLNAPTNVRVQQLPEGNVEILWDAPQESNAQVERYAISWQAGNGGWGVASTETNIYLSREVFSTTGGLDVTYSFTVRSDNDTIPVYSQASSPVYLFVSSPPVVPEPEPEVSESPTVSPEPTESPAVSDPNRIELRVNEGDFLGYVAPDGYRIARVESASYGADNGCHAENSLSIVESFVTETGLSISADNSVFGDPCGGTPKRLSVVLIIEQIQDAGPTPEEIAEAERIAAEQEAARIAAEQAAQAAAAEAARLEAERIEAERIAAEQAAQAAAAEAARLEAERVAAEQAAAEAARIAAEQAAAAEAARLEAERLEAARIEAERVADLERAERERQEKLAAEEAARLEAERLERERIAAEEAARLEAERLAAEEAARLAAEEAARLEAERLEAERLAEEAKAEAERLEAERIAAEEAARLEAERLAKQEAERLEAERIAKLEAEKLEAERLAKLEAERLAAEERARQEAEANKPTPTPEPSPTPTPAPAPTPTEGPVVVEIREPITAENITAVVAELTTIQPQQLTEEQQTLIVEAALETFATAEQGSEEYEAALDALLVVAQADDIVIDEELAAIPLIGNVAGAAVEVFNALGNAGADMSPQVREQSEKVVIASVIVANIAITATAAATSAAAVAARRP